jgi:iron complex transport system substrate-binding protein
VQWAATILHPDLFNDLNIKQKVHDFYATYLNYNLSEDEIALILAAKDPE